MKHKKIHASCFMLHASGFTLIELLIVIFVVVLFSGLSLSSYNIFNETKKLEAETRKVVEILELAKKKIVVGDNPNPATCQLRGYKVSYSGSTYQLFAQCPADTQIGSNFNLATNIVFTSATNVIFKPLGLGVEEARCLIIKNNNDNQCRKVNIEISGNINEQKEADCACP